MLPISATFNACSGSLINVYQFCQSIMRTMHTLNTPAIDV